ncbi:hypothetical protein Vretimale_8107 [Volvox reticuliferus]|uniref:N-acetyltransferase domain-containing protein n=1 Tax=Volvox reticuliferus TaxID=1737510 RepID=A0A8J4C678_9CHLO|nr:hypothetical protein Vretifemale_5255 [Volvox reticuliferus]GIM03354.1 hypothetical protein Vretimale_8107 [Volvox reticuliferus]
MAAWGIASPILNQTVHARQRTLRMPVVDDSAETAASTAACGSNVITTLEGAKDSGTELAAACFGKSMVCDPTLTWLTNGKCPERVVRFFHNVARMGLRAASDWSTCWALHPADPHLPGAKASETMPLPPKVVCIAYEYPRTFPNDWRWICGGLGSTLRSAPSLRAAGCFMKMVKAFNKAKERFFKEHGPFLYICCFGTDPEFQGKGLGSELMREVLTRAYKLGMPTYLEASGVESCRFYQRNGFQVLQEFRVEPDAPAMFLMAHFHGKALAAC